MSDWEDLLVLNSPCYGIILFELSPDNKNDKCVIVKTELKKEDTRSNIGFPKGKCEKLKTTKVRENIFQGVSRELKEETGIDFTQIMLADHVYLEEFSDKGNIATTYLVGKFINFPSYHTFTFDSNELMFSGLIDIDDAYKSLRKSRANLLNDAYNIIIDKATKFTDGILLLNKFHKTLNIKMETTKKYDPVKISKAMSYILRHGAQKLGITMDSEARILVSDLLMQSNFAEVTLEQIKDIVESNDKKRFELDTINGNLMIRAVQGHSKEFDNIIDEEKLLEEITEPLEKCIHGTDKSSWTFIQKEGLKPISRMHIHFAISETDDDKVISGMRQDKKVLIYVNMKKAMDDGIKFYMSKNKVILSKGKNGIMEPKYFENIIIKN